MSPPKTMSMIQKIRRLAASLGIGLRPPVDDAAAGVRLMRRSTDGPNSPAAQVRATGRRQRAIIVIIDNLTHVAGYVKARQALQAHMQGLMKIGGVPTTGTPH